MAITNTTNYGLTKDSEDEFYDVDRVNANSDIIDAEIKKAQDRADEAFQSANNGKETIKNAIIGVDDEVVIPTDATFQQLADAISQIETGVDTEDATATASQILAGMTAYIKEVKVTGTMPNNGSVGTQNLTTQNAEYTIPLGYHNGLGKVKAVITGLIESVIKAGTTAGGILGTFTADATAIASQMLAGVTAYVNGIKVTGTMPNFSNQTKQIINHAHNMNVYVDTADSRMGMVEMPNGLMGAGYVDTNTRFKAQLWGLLPENIKAGAYIGQYNGYGTGYMVGTFTADANGIANAFVSGYSGYVNGVKINGNIPTVADGTVAVNQAYWSPNTAGNIYARVHMMVPYGYHTGARWIYVDVPGLIASNLLNTANVLGMQGTAIAGKRSASGTTASNTTSLQCQTLTGETHYKVGLSITGLNFTPRLVLIQCLSSSQIYETVYNGASLISYPKLITCSQLLPGGGSANANACYKGDALGVSVFYGGFTLPIQYFNQITVDWWAYE